MLVIAAVLKARTREVKETSIGHGTGGNSTGTSPSIPHETMIEDREERGGARTVAN
jgi:hypothetical protein